MTISGTSHTPEQPGAWNNRNAQRKEDHIRLALQQQSETKPSAFDDVHLLHHALIGISPEEVSTATQLGDWEIAAPLYINGMTGGIDSAEPINRILARAAAANNIPMACGSVGIALDNPATTASFTAIREENTEGIVWANIGAGRPLSDARAAVKLLDADGLQIHLNAIQETVMPEGSREFSRWLEILEDIIAGLDVPVIVKEVGFGLSRDTLRILNDMGVQFADVAGSGGTNFARIENDRGRAPATDAPASTEPSQAQPSQPALNYDWMTHLGSTTVEALLDATTVEIPGTTLLASGGVRNPLDVIRCLALGARAVGVAGTFLAIAHREYSEGIENLMTSTLSAWIQRIAEIQALFGATTPARLTSTDVLVRGRSAEFAQLRGVNLQRLAQRAY